MCFATAVDKALENIDCMSAILRCQTKNRFYESTQRLIQLRRVLWPGAYEMDFHIGEYFRAQRQATADPPFLDVVPVRFGLAGGRDYHVPLLIQPYGYSTYRGS